MVCSRCLAARQAAKRAIRALASGRLWEAAGAAREVRTEIKSKVAESDRIRALTRKTRR